MTYQIPVVATSFKCGAAKNYRFKCWLVNHYSVTAKDFNRVAVLHILSYKVAALITKLTSL